MTTLIIDTTDNKKTTIKLKTGKKIDKISEESLPKSQTALILIGEIIKKNNLIPSDIDKIEVNSGPGSFTGTRVGVAIANALGFSLQKPVNGNKFKPVLPKYS